MSTRATSKKSDSTVEEVGVAVLPEIENIVAKAVKAAIEVVRNEFMKMYKELKDRISVLETSMESIGSQIQALEDKDTTAVTNEVTTTELEAIKKNLQSVQLHANDNEQYNKRNSLRIKGLKLTTDDNIRSVLHQFFQQQLHCIVDADEIDVAHVVSRKSSQSINNSLASASTPMTTQSSVIVKFKTREARDKIIKTRKVLKGTRITIQEDLTSLNMQTINRLHTTAHVKTVWTWNGKIFAQLHNGTKLLVRPFQQVHECTVLS